jgi:hypothetical protein
LNNTASPGKRQTPLPLLFAREPQVPAATGGGVKVQPVKLPRPGITGGALDMDGKLALVQAATG